MSTRGPDKQFDRSEALQKAMDLFWRNGYEATGVSELLETMGIGRQSMYDTFGNKRQLFLAALEEYGRREVGELIEILESPGSPLGNLDRVLGRIEREETKHCECGCLIGNTIAELGARDDEIAAITKQGLEIVKGAITGTLRRAQQAGEISPNADVEALATLMITSLQGAAVLMKAERDMELAYTTMRGLRAALAAA